MNNANVKLSKNELLLVTDASVILTKNNIIAKVYNLFGELSETFKNTIAAMPHKLPQQALATTPKIYKGEQYLGLPYVMLDCPRLYTNSNILAIRCFFWWGNFFSITLHLSGGPMHTYGPGLQSWLQQHIKQHWFICTNDDPWQHHFGENNYCSVDVMGNTILNEALATEGGFVKLAKKLPLQQWDGALSFFLKEYNELMQVFVR